MIFRSALIRLAAFYLLLLALILLCFNIIVYFSLSQALNLRVAQDLRVKAKVVQEGFQVVGDTIVPLPSKQIPPAPTYVDACSYVVQTSAEHPNVVHDSCRLQGEQVPLPHDPSIRVARAGQSSQTDVTLPSGESFAIRTEPFRNKDGKVVGVVQVIKGVSWIADTLNRLERQLAIASAVAMLLGAIVAILMARRSLRPLRTAFQKQRDFVADASHELRTPLTLMRTSAEAWLRRAAGGSGTIYAQHVLEEVDHLNAIVGDLTTLALADARQLRVEREPVELTAVVRELVEQAQPMADDRRLALRPNLNGAVRIQADAGRVRQLLLILLDNALRYTPAGGQISVAVARHNGRAEVIVEDTGMGIAPADLPHIFERFYRADKSRSRENGGIGLGLAIAKWIVDAHRGEIEVRSTPGRGTRVAVSLPTAE